MELSLGGWRASTSSRSAEFVDREWEEGHPANVNSRHVSSKDSTISTKEIIGTRCNESEVGRRTQYTRAPQSAEGRKPVGSALRLI